MDHSRLKKYNFLVYIVIILIFILFTFPKIGGAINTGIDDAYIYAFNLFFANRDLYQIGKNIIFIYGPLGFLLYPENVGSNLIIGTLSISLIYITLLINFIFLIEKIYFDKSLKYKICAYILPIFLLNYLNSYSGLAQKNIIGYLIFTLVIVLILNSELYKKRIFLNIALLLGTLTVLIKLNFAIISLTAIFSYILIQTYKTKKYKLLIESIIISVLTFLLLWIALYGNLEGIFNYLYSFYEFTKGNSSAMTLNTDNKWIFVFLSFTALIFPIYKFKDKNIYLTAAIFFLPFIATLKYAFSREDHILNLVIFLSIFSFFLILFSGLQKKILVSIVFVLASQYFLFLEVRALPYDLSKKTFSENIKGYFHIAGYKNINDILHFQNYKNSLDEKTKENLEKIKLSDEIKNLTQNKTVDIYPWEATYNVGNDFLWQPRSIFQSYLTYTPWLDYKNADYYKKTPPEFIIYDNNRENKSIDDRFIPNDEPLTYFQILQNYKKVAEDKTTILLQKKSEKTFEDNPSFEKNIKATWNEWIEVPSDSENLIIAKTNFELNIFGKIKKALYKEKAIYIEYMQGDGQIFKHRLAPDNAKNGIFVSPYLRKFEDLYNEDNKVVRVRFMNSEEKSYKEDLDVELEGYEIN